MSSRTLALAQFVVAGVALAGSLLSWLSSKSTEVVPPVIAGAPTTSSTIYDPSLVLLSLLLAGVAGVAVVAGSARFRRAAVR